MALEEGKNLTESVNDALRVGGKKISVKQTKADRPLLVGLLFSKKSYLRLYERCVIPSSFVKLGIDNVKRIVKKVIAMSIAENNSVFPDR